MKNIRESAVIDAFNKLYEASKKLIPVERVVTDEGSEFVSNAVKRWMTEKGVAHRILEPTYHYYSNSIVERFNLTLKQKLQKYMVANHTKKWVDALPDIVYAYNRSKHSYHANTPKSVAKNPFKQLIQRIKTIQSNLNLKAKKSFVLNRIREGSKVRLARKTDKAFSKRIQKFSKRRFTVEGVTKNRTMVKLAGVDRHVRPWEILVADETETNPHRRVITSPDVETALAKGRKAKSEGRVSKRMIRKEPVLKEAKKNREVNQSMVGRWVETEDGFQGTVVRATKTGLWLEVVANGKRSEMLVREGDPYTVLTSPPKATHDDADDAPAVSKSRTEMVGTTVETNSKTFSVTKVDTKKVFLVDENGRELSVTIDDDEEDNDFVDEEDEPLRFRSVPSEEALPDCTRAAPAFEHLLL
jgi:hypothetical protein